MPRKLSYLAKLDEKQIGARLRALRDREGISQVDLAKMLGMNQSLLSRYERGEVRMHGALLASLATIFKTSVDQILGLKEIKDQGLLKDRRFLGRIRQIDRLSPRKKQALLTTIDSFLGDERG